jgi:uncharacterized membrane protein HdeD (DUF308 family)
MATDIGEFTVIIVQARQWWAYALRGVLAIVFGVIAIFLPSTALRALILLFAFYALLDGVTALVSAWRTRGQRHWWVGVLEGVAGVAAGIVAIVWPEITAIALLFVVAFWAIMTGLLEIWAAIRLRDQIRGELFLGLAGLLSVAFGVYLIIFPGAGLLSLLWLVALFAILFGASMFMVGLRLRRIAQKATSQGEYAERGM